MPLFVFRCKDCGAVSRFLLSKRPEAQACTCGGKMESQSNLQAMVMESFDNGIMVRKIERLKDVEKMVKERSTTKTEDGIV